MPHIKLYSLIIFILFHCFVIIHCKHNNKYQNGSPGKTDTFTTKYDIQNQREEYLLNEIQLKKVYLRNNLLSTSNKEFQYDKLVNFKKNALHLKPSLLKKHGDSKNIRYVRSADADAELSNSVSTAPIGSKLTTPSNKMNSSKSSTFSPPDPNDTDDIVDNNKPVAALKTLTKGALIRAFYVFVGCSVIVMLYFMAKFAYRRRSKAYKKVSRGDEFDMFPLNVSDGDEDEEIFSANMNS